MPDKTINVIVWDENPGHADKIMYPRGLRGAIADAIRQYGGTGVEVLEAHLDEPDQGITEARLAKADVLLWWGHARHGEVEQNVADMVKKRVHQDGMGLVVLHSGHYSKIFKTVLDAPGHLRGGWRDDIASETEEITVCAPKHPIAEGIDDFIISREEMYGAPFDAPPAKTVVFQSYFPVGGEYFPSFAVTVGKGIDPEFTSGSGKGENQGEGAGRVFYFRPGHETFPTFYDSNVQKVIWNAVNWCARRS
jgi:trehalose utilization protein